MSSSQIQAAKTSTIIHPANRLGLDYAAQAMAMGTPIVPIIDLHSHIGGREASKIYAQAAEQYGISLTYSMTQLEQIEFVRDALGDRVRFIAVPNYNHEDRLYHHGRGYTERVEHDVTINIRSRLNAMGDAELMAYHAKLKSQLVDPHLKFLKKPIEGEVEKESPAEAGPKS